MICWVSFLVRKSFHVFSRQPHRALVLFYPIQAPLLSYIEKVWNIGHLIDMIGIAFGPPSLA